MMTNVPSLSVIVSSDGVPESDQDIGGGKIREVLADAFTFVRSVEANQAFSAVTIEQLMGDQIKRNGETQISNTSQYNPYTYDPEKTKPAGQETTEVANFLGGSDTGSPSKIDRILAVKNVLADLVKEIKRTEPLEVADAQEYADSVLDQLPEER